MKKGILLVLAALLIAGLFVSCNSDVATNKSGSEKDVAYVSFGNNGAKGLSTNTVMPVDPVIDDLDWYFKATKNSGIIRTGQRTNWTLIDEDGGLAGIIGPFAVGEWTFQLAAVDHEAAAPTEATYYDSSESKWVAEPQVVYVGRNTSVELEAANTSSDPKLIAIELERVNVSNNTTFNVNTNGIILLDGTSDSFDSGNVYYTLVIGKGANTVGVKEKTQVSVTASETAYVPSGSYDYTPSIEGEIVTITLNLYESNQATADVLKTASTTVAAFKGSTITITGNSDLIDAHVSFDVIGATVTVGTAAPLKYATLEAAILAVNAMDSVDDITITMLRDYTLDTTKYTHNNPLYISKSNVTLDMNEKTVTTDTRFAFGTNADNVTIENGNIVGIQVAGKKDDLNWNENGRYCLLVNNCDGVTLSGLTITGGVAIGGDPVVYAPATTPFTPNAGPATNVTVTDCSITQGTGFATKGYALFAQNHSDVTISASTLDGTPGNGALYSTAQDDGGEGYITVSSGTYSGSLSHGSNVDNLNIEGGSFTVDPQKYVPGYTAQQSYDTTGSILIDNYIITRTGESSSYTYVISYGL